MLALRLPTNNHTQASNKCSAMSSSTPATSLTVRVGLPAIALCVRVHENRVWHTCDVMQGASGKRANNVRGATAGDQTKPCDQESQHTKCTTKRERRLDPWCIPTANCMRNWWKECNAP
jgi:hypothetical protein